MKVFIIRADICDYDGCSTTLVKGFKTEGLAQTFCDFMNLSIQHVHEIINTIKDKYDEAIKSISGRDLDLLSEEIKIFYKKRMELSKEYGELIKQVEDRFTSHFGIKFDKDLSFNYEEMELED
jgi:hypothetical protein